MLTHDPAPSRSWTQTSARLLTEALAPSVIVFTLPLAVAWQATHALGPTLLWGVIVALTSSVLPMGIIVWGSRTGRWDSHHVRNREGRLIPFLALITLSLLGLAILVAAGAPWMVTALDISMILSLLVTGVITTAWKISMHAAVAAGAVAVLALVYSPIVWALSLVVAAIAWSRVALGDHTPAQVTIGALVGVLAGGGVYAVLT